MRTINEIFRNFPSSLTRESALIWICRQTGATYQGACELLQLAVAYGLIVRDDETYHRRGSFTLKDW